MVKKKIESPDEIKEEIAIAIIKKKQLVLMKILSN
ncbi:hypothetical protein BMW23_0584 [Bodo saltans virus]|uniref:Uncharacterized protein n=1 Tax=Bodo saltans virus TaxID=2024608 RepID=A0A2H4UUN5_9VIRU|nr:hypothetical protein QJ851_gp0567 [Bodo saltans virus]ATZ80630.1 hypothetical protein BMW23_0584 [Bodo saltans virus]